MRGLGDCGIQSDCLSIEPLETELGRKRRINQSTCNKDFSCVEGFCPSFVTVHGGTLRMKGTGAASRGSLPADMPAPELPVLESVCSVLVAGIGGTGVVTAGAIISMAAHLEGKAASSLDVTGLAQKYGSVMSHVRIANGAGRIFSPRLAEGEADLVLGSDLIVTAGNECLARLTPSRTRAFVNADVVPTGDFTSDPDWAPDAQALRERVAARSAEARFIDAARLASALVGDSIAANMFLLGVAWQLGRLPLSLEALQRAIELNGTAVEMNRTSFAWGRAYAIDPQAVERTVGPRPSPTKEQHLEQLVEHRAALLTDYQSASYAGRYRAMVARVIRAERSMGGSGDLAQAAARSYYKLLAHKDEFEVARLFCHPDFRALLDETFEGPYTLRFHLAGGPFSRTDRASGKRVKTEAGPWIGHGFKALSALRGLRGTWADPFRGSPERRLARELLLEYESDLEHIIGSLNAENYAAAVQLAGLPEQIRGYGHVREASAARARVRRKSLLAQQATL